MRRQDVEDGFRTTDPVMRPVRVLGIEGEVNGA